MKKFCCSSFFIDTVKKKLWLQIQNNVVKIRTKTVIGLTTSIWLTFTCSKSTIKSLEKGVKYVQSRQ